MKVKKYVIYAKDGFVMIKVKTKNLNCTRKSEIIDITLGSLEEMLIIFSI